MKHINIPFSWIAALLFSIGSANMPAQTTTSSETGNNSAQVNATTQPGANVVPTQNTTDKTTADEKEIIQLPPVTVTAQKRIQNIQDVPIEVSALTADVLKNSNFSSIEDIETITPGLSINQGQVAGVGVQVVLRGLGTPALSVPNLESSTGIFINGLYQQMAGLVLGDMTDVQRIEVLKGPQGTLFGKNTTAGVVSIFTNDPTFNREGEVSVTGGNYSDRQFEGFINAPIVNDKLAARISFTEHVQDGYLTDINKGIKYSNFNRYDLRGQLLWQLKPNMSLKLLAERNYRDEAGFPSVPSVSNANMVRANGIANASGLIGPLDILTKTAAKDYYTSFYYPWHQILNDQTYLADFNWDLGWAQFRSLSAFHYNNTFSQSDSTGPADVSYLQFTNPQLYRQWSEEMQLTGKLQLDLPLSKSLDWIVGAFYDNEYDNFLWQAFGGTQLTQLYGAALANAVAGKLDEWRSIIDTDTASLFLHVDDKITDRVHLIVGLRGNYEATSGKQQFFGTWPVYIGTAVNTLLPPGVDRHGSHCGEYLTGTAGLQYFFARDVNGYVTFAHGYKSGALDLSNDNDGVRGVTLNNLLVPMFVQPEYADDYEVGVKSQFFNHRLSVDVDVFDETFRNFQLVAYNGYAYSLISLPDESTKGFDVAVSARPFADFTVTASVQRADAKIGDDVMEAVAVGGAILAGHALPNAPLWVEDLSATYRHHIAGTRSSYFVHLDTSHQSSIITDVNQYAGEGQGPYWIVNGRMGVAFDGDKYEVALWAKNLTNTYYIFNQISTRVGIAAYPVQPRMWGLTFTSRF